MITASHVRSMLRSARLQAAMILAAAWALFFVYAWPGYLSPDSVLQLVEGRTRFYGDWHPPVMAALWGVLDRIARGPLLMLVAQSAAALFGMYAIFARAMSARRAALAAGAILLFPPVLTTMAVIWKDSQMAGYLLAGAGCLLSPRRRVRLVGCGFMFLATAVRINALAATFPLVVGLFVWRDRSRWWWRYAIAVGAWLVITGSASGVNTALTDAKQHPWHDGTAIHDIVGTIANSGPSSDEELARVLAGTPLFVHDDIWRTMRRGYSRYTFWNLNHGDGRVFDIVQGPEQLAPIARAWTTLVTDNPLAYLRHRGHVTTAALGLEPLRRGWGAVWDGFNDNGVARWDEIDFGSTHGAWQGFWVDTLRSIEKSSLFRPYLYLVLALLMLPLGLRDRAALGMLASGLAFEASVFIGAPTPDYRYSHWMITATVIGFVLVFAHRYHRGKLPGSSLESRSTRTYNA